MKLLSRWLASLYVFCFHFNILGNSLYIPGTTGLVRYKSTSDSTQVGTALGIEKRQIQFLGLGLYVLLEAGNAISADALGPLQAVISALYGGADDGLPFVCSEKVTLLFFSKLISSQKRTSGNCIMKVTTQGGVSFQLSETQDTNVDALLAGTLLLRHRTGSKGEQRQPYDTPRRWGRLECMLLERHVEDLRYPTFY